MQNKFYRIWHLVLPILLLTACVATPLPSTAPVPSASDNQLSEYLIGPRDIVQVFVWRNPDISVTIPVRPDGKISTPLVEDMLAVGKTPTQLARDIEKVLATYIKAPVVNVIVSDFAGRFSDQIRVIGQAENPKALPFREQITLLDVLIEVGGLSEFAAGNRAKVVRREGAKTREIAVRLEDLISSGDMSANIRMSPGDILIIPESSFL